MTILTLINQSNSNIQCAVSPHEQKLFYISKKDNNIFCAPLNTSSAYAEKSDQTPLVLDPTTNTNFSTLCYVHDQIFQYKIDGDKSLDTYNFYTKTSTNKSSVVFKSTFNEQQIKVILDFSVNVVQINDTSAFAFIFNPETQKMTITGYYIDQDTKTLSYYIPQENAIIKTTNTNGNSSTTRIWTDGYQIFISFVMDNDLNTYKCLEIITNSSSSGIEFKSINNILNNNTNTYEDCGYNLMFSKEINIKSSQQKTLPNLVIQKLECMHNIVDTAPKSLYLSNMNDIKTPVVLKSKQLLFLDATKLSNIEIDDKGSLQQSLTMNNSYYKQISYFELDILDELDIHTLNNLSLMGSKTTVDFFLSTNNKAIVNIYTNEDKQFAIINFNSNTIIFSQDFIYTQDSKDISIHYTLNGIMKKKIFESSFEDASISLNYGAILLNDNYVETQNNPIFMNYIDNQIFFKIKQNVFCLQSNKDSLSSFSKLKIGFSLDTYGKFAYIEDQVYRFTDTFDIKNDNSALVLANKVEEIEEEETLNALNKLLKNGANGLFKNIVSFYPDYYNSNILDNSNNLDLSNKNFVKYIYSLPNTFSLTFLKTNMDSYGLDFIQDSLRITLYEGSAIISQKDSNNKDDVFVYDYTTMVWSQLNKTLSFYTINPIENVSLCATEAILPNPPLKFSINPSSKSFVFSVNINKMNLQINPIQIDGTFTSSSFIYLNDYINLESSELAQNFKISCSGESITLMPVDTYTSQNGVLSNLKCDFSSLSSKEYINFDQTKSLQEILNTNKIDNLTFTSTFNENNLYLNENNTAFFSTFIIDNNDHIIFSNNGECVIQTKINLSINNNQYDNMNVLIIFSNNQIYLIPMNCYSLLQQIIYYGDIPLFSPSMCVNYLSLLPQIQFYSSEHDTISITNVSINNQYSNMNFLYHVPSKRSFFVCNNAELVLTNKEIAISSLCQDTLATTFYNPLVFNDLEQKFEVISLLDEERVENCSIFYNKDNTSQIKVYKSVNFMEIICKSTTSLCKLMAVNDEGLKLSLVIYNDDNTILKFVNIDDLTKSNDFEYNNSATSYQFLPIDDNNSKITDYNISDFNKDFNCNLEGLLIVKEDFLLNVFFPTSTLDMKMFIGYNKIILNVNTENLVFNNTVLTQSFYGDYINNTIIDSYMPFKDVKLANFASYSTFKLYNKTGEIYLKDLLETSFQSSLNNNLLNVNLDDNSKAISIENIFNLKTAALTKHSEFGTIMDVEYDSLPINITKISTHITEDKFIFSSIILQNTDQDPMVFALVSNDAVIAQDLNGKIFVYFIDSVTKISSYYSYYQEEWKEETLNYDTSSNLPIILENQTGCPQISFIRDQENNFGLVIGKDKAFITNIETMKDFDNKNLTIKSNLLLKNIPYHKIDDTQLYHPLLVNFGCTSTEDKFINMASIHKLAGLESQSTMKFQDKLQSYNLQTFFKDSDRIVFSCLNGLLEFYNNFDVLCVSFVEYNDNHEIYRVFTFNTLGEFLVTTYEYSVDSPSSQTFNFSVNSADKKIIYTRLICLGTEVDNTDSFIIDNDLLQLQIGKCTFVFNEQGIVCTFNIINNKINDQISITPPNVINDWTIVLSQNILQDTPNIGLFSLLSDSNNFPFSNTVMGNITYLSTQDNSLSINTDNNETLNPTIYNWNEQDNIFSFIENTVGVQDIILQSSSGGLELKGFVYQLNIEGFGYEQILDLTFGTIRLVITKDATFLQDLTQSQKYFCNHFEEKYYKLSSKNQFENGVLLTNDMNFQDWSLLLSDNGLFQILNVDDTTNNQGILANFPSGTSSGIAQYIFKQNINNILQTLHISIDFSGKTISVEEIIDTTSTQ